MHEGDVPTIERRSVTSAMRHGVSFLVCSAIYMQSNATPYRMGTCLSCARGAPDHLWQPLTCPHLRMTDNLQVLIVALWVNDVLASKCGWRACLLTMARACPLAANICRQVSGIKAGRNHSCRTLQSIEAQQAHDVHNRVAVG
jgi:hypothetical protein